MTTLLESGARPYGSAKGVALSMALHGGIIAAAIIGTAAVALPSHEKIEEHPIVYVAPPPPAAEPVHVAPPPPAVKTPKANTAAVKRAEPPRPKMAQPQPKAAPAPTIAAPTRIAVSIPAPDVKAPVIGDIVAAPAPDRIATGSSHRVTSESGGDVEDSRGGLNSGSSNKAYSENEVERAVEVVRAPEPRYPDALKSTNVEGAVMMRFIVSADGRVEPGSIAVVSSPNKLFSDAVRTALLSARYRPAQAGGHAVRQLVEQSFSFRLQK